MKNKEAIEKLLAMKKCGGLTNEYRQALNLAIKALEFTDDFFHETFSSYLNGVFGHCMKGEEE